MSKKQPISVTDLLGEDTTKNDVVETKQLPTPHIGDIVLFTLRAINDGGEVQVFPAMIIEVKGTSAGIKVFRGNFDEYFTKIPQSFDLQPGFWTCR